MHFVDQLLTVPIKHVPRCFEIPLGFNATASNEIRYQALYKINLPGQAT
jgi:hypothetical protein